MWVVLNLFRWSFISLALREFPFDRPDKCEWQPDSDDMRSSVAGNGMVLFGACIFIQGDWQEWATSFGFFNWTHLLSPCWLCLCTNATMNDDDAYTVEDEGWAPFTFASYSKACSDAMIAVIVTPANHGIIASALEWVKHKKRGGRLLNRSIVCANLEAGDRLEPSCLLQDIGKFEELDVSSGDKEVFFWRESLQTRTKHLNPIFHGDIGITHDIVVPDV